MPQNTVVQHFAADGSPLRLLASQNRVFKHLGYDKVHYVGTSHTGMLGLEIALRHPDRIDRAWPVAIAERQVGAE